jgi:poly-gamma-glutamate biosynthesis protein PgsC/CapC
VSSEYVLVLGVVVSLLMTELVGISPGGIIVPGYLALYLTTPLRLSATLLDAGLALLLVGALSRGVVLFGRRRYAAFLLSGFLARVLLERLVPALAPEVPVLAAVGWLIPGILAADAHRQGIWKTLAALAAAALVVRLLWAALA